jgi:hypothetical protein
VTSDDDNLAAIDDPRVVECRRVIALLDACGEINDPDRAVAAKDNAFARGMALIKLLLGDLCLERMGAARLARALPFKPASPWGDKALEVGRAPVGPARSDMDRNEAAAQRWQAVRFFKDFESLMTPGLARNFVGAMLNLNVGVDSSLTRPLRVKGLPKTPSGVLQFFRALLVYYRAGYHNQTIEQVLSSSPELFSGLTHDALKKSVQRLNIAEMVAIAKAAGAADKAAGKPEDPEYKGCKDFIAYMAAINAK